MANRNEVLVCACGAHDVHFRNGEMRIINNDDRNLCERAKPLVKERNKLVKDID